MSFLENIENVEIYDSYNMSDLDCVVDIEPDKISSIIVSIYLYDLKIYDNILDEDTLNDMFPYHGAPLGTLDQIDFLTRLCSVIIENGGVYKLTITINKK